jgi:Cdc6-like AAA superfamily ATPase
MLASETQQILKIINSETRGKLLQLETGKHFNLGQKFFQFSTLLSEEASQDCVFEECGISAMCSAFLQGRNCNLLVYGPTNSGKTFTMQG